MLQQAVWLHITALINWKCLTHFDIFFGDGEAVDLSCCFRPSRRNADPLVSSGSIIVIDQVCMQGKGGGQLFISNIFTHVPLAVAIEMPTDLLLFSSTLEFSSCLCYLPLCDPALLICNNTDAYAPIH